MTFSDPHPTNATFNIANSGGVPIGAALYNAGTSTLLGSGHNKRVQLSSPILHGETDCLANIGRLPASVYKTCTMYTTLSPCSMCAGAVLLFGIRRVVVGENESFLGAEGWLRRCGVEVVNLGEPLFHVVFCDNVVLVAFTWPAFVPG